MSKPSVLLSHPTGNQNVRNALQSLAENEMLSEFWTSIAWDAESSWNRLLPAAMRVQLARRAFPQAPKGQIHSVPFREMVRLGARTSPLHTVLSSNERPFSIIGMYRSFDRKVASRLKTLQADAVYAYEGAALQTFRAAKQSRTVSIYEQPSSHWYWTRDLLGNEAERNPEFANLLPSLMDSAKHLAWKDEELRLADFVFVPSQHVRRTLSGVVPEDRIRVINYGAPPVRHRPFRAPNANHPLRVLFVGTLSQHKGIGYLLNAVKALGSRVEVTLVGRRFRPNTQVDEACSRWRWFETLPHSKVLETMEQADVLALPSFGEGFGLVVTEAMACGLPVIVTPNVGAGDLIRDGREGFLVPVGSSEAIAECLEVLSRDRQLLAEMSRNAQATAAEKTWKSYRENLAQSLRTAICG